MTSSKNAILAIIVVAAMTLTCFSVMNAADAASSTTEMNEGFSFEVDTVARVYGNANGDDKIDAADIEMIQNIIAGKIVWDKAAYPYVDANYDGTIDAKDIKLVRSIIDVEECTVYYENYYGEAQAVEFPLIGKKIGLTYWQQGQLVDLLGHFGDVVIANASITQARSNQYDVSGIIAYGTTGSSRLTEEFCELYEQAGVDLIIGSPYKATVADVAATYLPDVPLITLGIGGQACVSSALTLGILMNANEAAQNYEEYVVNTINTIKERLSVIPDEEKPTMLVTRMYADNDAYIAKYGGILVNCAKTDGSYQLLSMFANLYTDNSETGTTPARSVEWIMSQDFDLILDMEVYTGFQTSGIEGEKYYTQEEYNARFENSVKYFEGTKAYDNNGILSSSYIFDGYSGFASLMMSAYMIYPALFTLEEGQDSLQYWYSNFTASGINVRTDGGYYYTGTEYTTQFMPTAMYADITLDDAVLKVLGNANGDDKIDAQDAEIIEYLAERNASVEKYPLADANNDGVIDSKDVELVNAIYQWQTGDAKVQIWNINFHDTNGDGIMDTELVSTMFPISSAIMTGSSNSFILTYMLDIIDEIKGATYGSTNDKALFSDNYLDASKVVKLGTSSSSITFEDGKAGSSNVIAEQNVTALLTDWNRTYITNEAAFEAANVDVVRVSAAGIDRDSYAHSILLLGLLFQKQDRAEALLALYDSAYAFLDEIIEDAPEVSAVAASMTGYISSGGSDYTAVIIRAGATFGLADYDFGGSTSIKTADHLDVWDTDKYNFDVIIHLRTAVDYGGTWTDATVESYANGFSLWSGNSQYIVGGSMPVPLRCLYAAVALYPDLVTKADIDPVSQAFIGFYDKDFDAATLNLVVDCSNIHSDATDVEITGAVAAISVGGSCTFGYTISGNADNRTVVWTSSDESIATVDAAGNVTAIALGDVVITATSADGAVSDSVEISIVDDSQGGDIIASIIKAIVDLLISIFEMILKIFGF